MRRLVLLLGLCAVAALPAAAQQTELFAGYSYLRLSNGTSVNLNGWNVAVERELVGWFGIVADVSGHYGSPSGVSIDTLQALFGPRLKVDAGLVEPFVHVLFGAARGSAGVFGSTSSDVALGVAVGGGLDIGIGPVAWRAVQVDYLRTELFGATQNNTRVATGIVLRF